VLPLSILGFAPGRAPLAVLAVTSMLALDPGERVESAVEAAEQSVTEPEPVEEPRPADSTTAVTDGGENADLTEGEDSSAAYGYPGEEDGDERRPWL
jgi:hypothetical protein